MNNFGRCPNCERYEFLSRHKCPPEWQVILNDYDDPDEPRRAFGETSEDAVLDVAERKFEEWDCPSNMELWVRKSSDDPWEKFDISVEAVPSFSANRKD